MLLLLLPLFVPGLHAQSVQWTEFADLPDSLRREARPLLIFIHTDWCKYCKLQDRNTFRDPEVSATINEQFYALRLDAESTENIPFLNREFKARTNDYHELAQLLGRQAGQLVFPTTVILNRQWQLIHRFSGLLKSEDLLPLINVE